MGQHARPAVRRAPRYSPLRLVPASSRSVSRRRRAPTSSGIASSARLAERCAGPLGRDLALGLAFAATRERGREWLAQSREATRLLAEGRSLPAADGRDVRDALDRARVGGVLAPGGAPRGRDGCSGPRARCDGSWRRAGATAPDALRGLRDRPDARRRRRRDRRLLRGRRDAGRSRQPPAPRAAERVARGAAADALAHGGPDEPVRVGRPGPLRHRARGPVGAPGPVGRARALPRDRARDEQQRGDAVRRAARRRAAWATASRCSRPR